MRRNSILIFVCCISVCVSFAQSSDRDQKQIKNEAFTIKASRYGIGEIFKTNDVHVTNYVRNGRVSPLHSFHSNT